MSNKDSLGDRMKGYEDISRIYLTRRCPIIIRIDGCHFHTFTRGLKRPFDDILIQTMQETAMYLCEHIMGCKLAYTQSDEISLLITDYDRIESQAWFEKNLQKMVSVAASMATMAFNGFLTFNFNNMEKPKDSTVDNEYNDYYDCVYNKQCLGGGATFDARAFVLPKEEVCNYFIWRQQDATRNSIQMVGQANFSHKELQNKSCNLIQDMLHEQKNINWNDFEPVYKRGSCVVKQSYCTADLNTHVGPIEPVTRTRWVIDSNTPVFTQNRSYIENHV